MNFESYSIFYFLIIFFLPSEFLCVNPPLKGGSFGQNIDFVSILDRKNLFITSIIIVETPLRDSLDYPLIAFFIS